MLPFILRELYKWGWFLVLLLKTAVAGEDAWCFTSAREEYPCLGWVCLGNGVVTLCTEQKVPQENAIHEYKQTWYLGTNQVSGLWIKRMSWDLLHFLDIPCCTSLIQLHDLRGVFLAGKSGCFQPEPSNHLTGCPRLSFSSLHSFFPFVCPSSPLKATRQGSEDHHRHSVVGSIKPKGYCLALKLSGQPLYAETEGLFR